MDVQVIKLSNPLWLNTLSQIRHDIYHLPEYVCLESIRTQANPEAILIVDGEKIFFLPYLLRQCDDILPEESTRDEIFDVVSPYGYPGILLSEAALNTPGFLDLAMDELKSVLRERGVCSAFFRLHPILNHNLDKYFKPGTLTDNGETVSVDLTLSESKIWSHTRKGHRSTINKCKRLGMIARMVPVREYLNELAEIQKETMERVGASQRYFDFDYDYFLNMYNTLGNKIHLCIVEVENQVACVGLYTECCGIVQSTLGGTRNKFVNLSPGSLEIDYVRYWAKERGNEFLHLGGGLGGVKDSLNTFKSGFSKQRDSFLTLRLITDEEKYRYLVELRAKALGVRVEELSDIEFFPAYRLTRL